MSSCSSFAPGAFAQASASIAGTVRDTSGAVLPGVTVEAASPALIEKVRIGRHRRHRAIQDRESAPRHLHRDVHPDRLQYVKRDGIELAGSFAATVNPDMKVGALEETVTVTGESPIVDVQSATKQRVIDEEVLDAIPTGRTPSSPPRP